MKKLLIAACAAVCCLLGAQAVPAATLQADTGTLADAQDADGNSTNSVNASGARALYVEYVLSSGTATITTEQQLTGGTNFQTVSGSSQTSSTILKIDYPAGLFRTNIASCSIDCEVTTKYHLVFDREYMNKRAWVAPGN